MLKCTRREGSIILLYDFNAGVERHENNIDDFVYHDYTI